MRVVADIHDLKVVKIYNDNSEKAPYHYEVRFMMNGILCKTSVNFWDKELAAIRMRDLKERIVLLNKVL